MFLEIKRLIKIYKIKMQKKNIIFLRKANIDKNAVLEGQNKIGAESWFEGYMGFGTYIGDQCTIMGKIGRYCSIGHKVTVLTGTHPSHRFVSTHPTFFSLGLQNGTTYVSTQKFKEKIYADENNKYGCIIGNDVWIGYNATIMGGCTIGDGAIVAAGALVKENVEPYTIVAGQPAKVIGKRFEDEKIAFLMKIKWWDKPEAWIKSHADDFEDISKFERNISRGES
ncbi:CatB-related O-acetyltransferase [Mediterraneibacter sp. NSJ-151]|uniref:CatB-related O-acetyltransferase n=1 Tax=Mediterraneibacter sp. NSJ-151 TaxID=2897708 RepID=UPI001F0A3A8D|nr:CatB-related O-acetyltransferase [Mediterraneibacter sp. NSJ-151]MCH4280615.1 CatB-related O-acetyltransferase [Mediterraneibacter sp. NSJ-151]